jgi:O-antigen/teichoic acid export membrane protein
LSDTIKRGKMPKRLEVWWRLVNGVTKKLFKNDLTIIYPILLAGLRMVVAFSVAKIAATQLSIAEFGQFQQFINYFSMISMLSTGGITNLIVKNISEDSFSQNKSQKITFFLILVMTLVSVIHLLGANGISLLLFNETRFSSEMIVIAIAIFFLGASNFITAIQVGQKQLKEQFIISLIHSSLLVIAFFGFSHGLDLSRKMIIYTCMLATLILVQLIYYKAEQKIKSPFSMAYFGWQIDLQSLKEILFFASATIIAIISFPLSQTYTRNLLMQANDWTLASFWQAATRITDVYMQIAGTVFLTYYFARYANKAFQLKDLPNSFIRVIAISTPFIIIIYLGREPLISLLYTPDYIQAEKFFLGQIGGDLIKLLNLSFAYFLLAKGEVLYFIIIDLSQSIFWIIFSHLTLQAKNDFFVVNSFLYAQILTFFTILTILLFRKQINSKKYMELK